MTEEIERRKKKLFPFKLPSFKFGSKLPVPNINIGPPTGVERSVSFVVDKDTGTLDLNSVPPEFQELVQNLYENISQPKTVMQIEEKAEDEQEVVRKRKGPSVAKGLKDEEILREMRSLVISADPWDIYSMVNDVRILIFFCFDHHQALL